MALLSVLAGAPGFVGSEAHAQPATSAEALFRDGRQAMLQGNLEDARVKLEASQKLDPAAGTLLNLAECYELLKKVASAWETNILAKEAATKRGRNDWVQLAAERIARLEPRMPRFKLHGLPEKARVQVDGKAVDGALLAASIPIDPGKHRVVVSVDKGAGTTRDFEAQEGVTSEVDVSAAPEGAVPPSAKGDTRTAGGSASPLTWVFAGVSVAAFATGGVLLAVRDGQVGKVIDAGCTRGMDAARVQQCDGLAASVMSFAPPAIALGAGGAFAIASLVVYFTSKSGPPKTSRIHPECSPFLGGGTCSVQF